MVSVGLATHKQVTIATLTKQSNKIGKYFLSTHTLFTGIEGEDNGQLFRIKVLLLMHKCTRELTHM